MDFSNAGVKLVFDIYLLPSTLQFLSNILACTSGREFFFLEEFFMYTLEVQVIYTQLDK